MSRLPDQADDDLIQRSEASAQKLRQLLQRRAGVQPAPLREAAHADPPRVEKQDVVLCELAPPSGPTEWVACFWGNCSRSPNDETGASLGQRVSPKIVESLIRHVPALSEAVRRRELFELVGPAGVVEKLRSGALELVPSQDGTVLGTLRVPQKNKIVQQARFRKIELTASVGFQLAFSALTIAVGASYMARIERQLAALNEKVDRVLDSLRISRHARLASAMDLLKELNRQYASAGHFASSMRQRLLDVERDLIGSYHELEQMHGGYQEHFRAMADAPVEKFGETYDSRRGEILADARALVVAQTCLIEVDRLALLCEMEHEPELVAYREEKLGTAQARLRKVGECLKYLEEFNDSCCKAIQRAQRQTVRYIWKGSTVEKVSARLHQDRLAVSDIMAELRQVQTQKFQPERPTIIRIDARGGELAAYALPAHIGEQA